MNEILPYLKPFLLNISRYFIIAGIPFLIVYVMFPKAFSRNKIQQRFAQQKDFLREILHSMQMTFILAGIAVLIIKSPLRAYTQIYHDLGDFPLWWIPVSVILALVVHDTYFYWMHRSVHHPKLYKHVHLVHHKSINPSPWASYSFHFWEAILEAMIAPIILFLIPLHPLALFVFAFLSFSINVYGHLGYEVAPRWFRHSILFEILNTSVHHNMHHSKFKGNYGLYFRLWDRFMGTEHPNYVQEYDRIQEQRFGSPQVGNGRTWRNTALVILFIIGLGSLSVAGQSSIEGTWKDNEEGGTVLIYEDDSRYFGRVIAADDKAEHEKIQNHEVIVLKGFEQQNHNTYCCGTLYQPRYQRTLSGELILESANRLKVKGYYGIFSGTRVWERVEP